MDQVKRLLAVMIKQRFWIGTGLVAIVCSVGYFMARSALSSRITTRTAAIESQFTSVKAVQSAASTHPNQKSHEQMDAIIKRGSEDVKSAWEMKFNRQSKIFVWPEDALPPDTKMQTLNKLKALLPIETKIAYPLVEPQPLFNTERNVYRDYIEKRFPQLAKIIDTEWNARMRSVAPAMGMGMAMGSSGGGKGTGAPGGGIGMEGGMEGSSGSGYGGEMGTGSGMEMARRPANARPPTVNWSFASQQQLMDSICNWYNPTRPPNTLQICYTQEDLWILEGILRIIAATNDGARANFQAAIKEIEFIRFCSAAMNQSGSVIMQQEMGAPGAMGSEMEGSSGGMPGKGGGGAPAFGSAMEGSSGGEGMASAIEIDPADNRYVDATFKPIAGADLRTAMQSNSPTDAPLVVAKRIPVRLRFSKMDQRKINKLIIECGSSGTPDNPRLVLEVRQVRVNGVAVSANAGGMFGGGGGMGQPGAGIGMGSGSGSGGDGYGMGMGSSGSGMGMGSEGSSDMGMGMGSNTNMGSGYDVPVEIYGIIYLYNPVDMEKLGLSNINADTNLEAGPTDAAATPAAATPAVAAPAPANPAVDAPASAPVDATNEAVPPAGSENGVKDASEQPKGSEPAAEAPVNPGTPSPAANPETGQ